MRARTLLSVRSSWLLSISLACSPTPSPSAIDAEGISRLPVHMAAASPGELLLTGPTVVYTDAPRTWTVTGPNLDDGDEVYLAWGGTEGLAAGPCPFASGQLGLCLDIYSPARPLGSAVVSAGLARFELHAPYTNRPHIYLQAISRDGYVSSTSNVIEVEFTRDFDNDGLTTWQENQVGADPENSDSDGDGLSDGDEVHVHGTNPTALDSDGDGYEDGVEIAEGSDPNNTADQPLDGVCGPGEQGPDCPVNGTGPCSGALPTEGEEGCDPGDGTLFVGLYDADVDGIVERLFVAAYDLTDAGELMTDGAVGRGQIYYIDQDPQDVPSILDCPSGSASTTACSDGLTMTANLLADSVDYEAARLCDTLDAAGHDDWYLPTRNEWVQISANLVAADADADGNGAGDLFNFDHSGGFPASFYWPSSSHNTVDGGMYVRATDGRWFERRAKRQAISVRCMRRDELPADADGMCAVNEPPSSDCDSVCDFVDQPGSADCDGACQAVDDPSSPDCDAVCGVGDDLSTQDCDAVCNPLDEPGSVDCDGTCNISDEAASADCDAVCDAGEEGSLDCPITVAPCSDATPDVGEEGCDPGDGTLFVGMFDADLDGDDERLFVPAFDLAADGQLMAYGQSPRGAIYYVNPAPATTNTLSCPSGSASTTACSDGLAMTANLLAESSAYEAARLCDELVAAGHSDWYQPARNELDLVLTNLIEVDTDLNGDGESDQFNFGVSGIWPTSAYWPSSGNTTWAMVLSAHDSRWAEFQAKQQAAGVRCMRRTH